MINGVGRKVCAGHGRFASCEGLHHMIAEFGDSEHAIHNPIARSRS